MNQFVRTTTKVTFFLVKLGIFIFVTFAVMAFLGEIANRMRMRLPQPFRGAAVIAMAVASGLPFAKGVDGLKNKIIGEAFEDEDESFNPSGDALADSDSSQSSGSFTSRLR